MQRPYRLVQRCQHLLAVPVCLSLACHAPAARPTVQVPAVALAPDTSWVARSAIYELFVRDFSPRGDLRGVIDGLDRIQAVGANVIWLMPIYPIGLAGRKGTLGSPYSVRDYYAIASALGTMADFKELVRAVHARGMKLIVDWVPNHTALDAVWVHEHPDFYVRDEQGKLIVPHDLDGNPTDWTDVVQLDYRNPALRRAMTVAMRHWLMDLGIDGFRVDVAGFVPDDFWREAIPELRSSVPRPVLLLAESGDLTMHQLGFDLSYAWDSYSRLKEVWRGALASIFVPPEVADQRTMRPGGQRLRFTTNHDETGWDDPPVTIFGGATGARAAFVAMALLPGRPLIYNGQEIESPQKLRLFERDPIAWDRPRAAEARAFYRRVLDLSRTHTAFSVGDLRVIESSSPDEVIAYGRGDAAVVVNTRPREVRVTVPGFDADGSVDLLSNRPQLGDTVVLPAYGAVVLERPGR